MEKGLWAKKLSNDKKGLAAFWPEKKEWHEALKHALYIIPCFAEDYAKRNVDLQKILKQELGEKCPRFGEDYLVRMGKYRALVNMGTDVGAKYSFRPWHYPVVIAYNNRKILERKSK